MRRSEMFHMHQIDTTPCNGIIYHRFIRPDRQNAAHMGVRVGSAANDCAIPRISECGTISMCSTQPVISSNPGSLESGESLNAMT